MSVLKYVQSLLPRIAKRDVLDNINLITKEIREQTLPPYLALGNTIGKDKFRSDYAKKFETRFQKQIKTRVRGNNILVTTDLLTKTLDNLDIVKSSLDDLDGDIMRSAITFLQTQLIFYVDRATFVSKYSRLVLIHILDNETAEYRKGSKPRYSLSKSQIGWLVAHEMDYFEALNVCSKSEKDIKDLIKNIPDIEVDEETISTIESTAGQAKVNPLNVNNFTTTFNIYYHIGIALADWQHNRYQAAKEERRLVEYQILDLKNAVESKPDPKLEKALEYTQDRLSKINYKIAKYEEG